jgi:hypothetical protein
VVNSYDLRVKIFTPAVDTACGVDELVVTEEAWPYGLRCMDCNMNMQEGTAYSKRLVGITGPADVDDPSGCHPRPSRRLPLVVRVLETPAELIGCVLEISDSGWFAIAAPL